MTGFRFSHVGRNVMTVVLQSSVDDHMDITFIVGTHTLMTTEKAINSCPGQNKELNVTHCIPTSWWINYIIAVLFSSHSIQIINAALAIVENSMPITQKMKWLKECYKWYSHTQGQFLFSSIFSWRWITEKALNRRQNWKGRTANRGWQGEDLCNVAYTWVSTEYCSAQKCNPVAF